MDDTKRLADAEARDRATLMSKFKNLSSELDTMRERIEEESEQKAEILKQLSKAQAEIQLWRSKYETEGLGRWVGDDDICLLLPDTKYVLYYVLLLHKLKKLIIINVEEDSDVEKNVEEDENETAVDQDRRAGGEQDKVADAAAGGRGDH